MFYLYSGVGELIRRDLMNKCNLHTILRLPTGIFYAKGVQTNVLFFERGATETNNTKEIWIYDLRNNMRTFGKRNPLNKDDFKEFVECYKRDYREERQELWNESNTNGRWRKYSIEEILKRDSVNLDISWIEPESEETEYTILEMLDLMQEKSDNIAHAVAQLKELLGEVEE